MKKWFHQLITSFGTPALWLAPRQPAAIARDGGTTTSAVGSPFDLVMVDSVTIDSVMAHSVLADSALAEIDTEAALFAWLVDRHVDLQAQLGAREQQALLQLDRLAGDACTQNVVVPRAAAVVPRLLAQLRGGASSWSELSQQVSRDVSLVAEVIRMANAATYRQRSAVVDLEHAIRVLGIDGLRFAIAKAVLKPMMNSGAGELSSRAAHRLWQHTDCKAQLAAALARGDGLDPFDAYLLALAHNAVWCALLRSMDSVTMSAVPWRFSAVFARTLATHRDRLFAVVARQWQLNDGLIHIASEVAQHGLGAVGSSAPVRLLRAADHLAGLLCTHDSAVAKARAEPLLAELPSTVQQSFFALTIALQVKPH